MRLLQHAPEQSDHELLDLERISGRPRRQALEELALCEVRRGVARSVAEPEGSVRALFRGGIQLASRFERQSAIDAEPVATVAVDADRVAPIDLPLVVERHDLGIRRERSGTMMTYHDTRSRKHEDVSFDGSGIVEARVVDGTTKGADPHSGTRVDDLLRRHRLAFRH
jgi:hypothetical protein